MLIDEKKYMKEYHIKYREKNRDKLNMRSYEHYHNNKEQYLIKLKNKRHKHGISKKYKEEFTIEHKKTTKRMNNRVYRERIKIGGKLSIKIVQLVYEDNIKKFGTLTCYLCFNPIEFKKDHLEHKMPLSRGGTNDYNNLGVSCERCNCKKHNKTEEEFRRENNR